MLLRHIVTLVAVLGIATSVEGDEVASNARCGPNVVYIYANLLGRQTSERDIDSLFAVNNERGFSLQELEEALTSLGLQVRVIHCSMAVLKDLPVPFIAHLQRDLSEMMGHYVVVVGVDDEWIRTIDGTTGAKGRYARARFNKLWTGYVLSSPPRESRFALFLAIFWSCVATVGLYRFLRRNAGANRIAKSDVINEANRPSNS